MTPRPTWKRRFGEPRIVHALRVTAMAALIILFSPIIGVSLLAILLFLLVMAPFVMICHPIRAGLRDMRLRSRLRRAKRLINPDEALGRLERGEGTLFVQAVAPGWSDTRLWWTDDQVLDTAPTPSILRRIPEWRAWASTRFVDWCESRYLDVPGGRALMLNLSRGKTKDLCELLSKRTCPFDVVVVCRATAWNLEGGRHCRHCGYDLVGLEGDLCPECGEPIREPEPVS